MPGMSIKPRIRAATPADLPRIHEIRTGIAENPLTEADGVTDAEVVWYMNAAIFLVSEDDAGAQGFTCVNPQTGYVWALFVIDGKQGQGHGGALLDAAMARLRDLGHRQAFLTTGVELRAVGFYEARGWRKMGTNMAGDLVFRLWL